MRNVATALKPLRSPAGQRDHAGQRAGGDEGHEEPGHEVRDAGQPRRLAGAAATAPQREADADRDDEQRPRQLDDDGVLPRVGAEHRTGGHHRRRVVDRRAREQTERLLGHRQAVAEQREQHDRHRVEDEHGGQRVGDVRRRRVDDRGDRGDGARPTDRGADADERAQARPNPEKSPHHHRGDQADGQRSEKHRQRLSARGQRLRRGSAAARAWPPRPAAPGGCRRRCPESAARLGAPHHRDHHAEEQADDGRADQRRQPPRAGGHGGDRGAEEHAERRRRSPLDPCDSRRWRTRRSLRGRAAGRRRRGPAGPLDGVHTVFTGAARSWCSYQPASSRRFAMYFRPARTLFGLIAVGGAIAVGRHHPRRGFHRAHLRWRPHAAADPRLPRPPPPWRRRAAAGRRPRPRASRPAHGVLASPGPRRRRRPATGHQHSRRVSAADRDRVAVPVHVAVRATMTAP